MRLYENLGVFCVCMKTRASWGVTWLSKSVFVRLYEKLDVTWGVFDLSLGRLWDVLERLLDVLERLCASL